MCPTCSQFVGPFLWFNAAPLPQDFGSKQIWNLPGTVPNSSNVVLCFRMDTFRVHLGRRGKGNGAFGLKRFFSAAIHNVDLVDKLLFLYPNGHIETSDWMMLRKKASKPLCLGSWRVDVSSGSPISGTALDVWTTDLKGTSPLCSPPVWSWSPKWLCCSDSVGQSFSTRSSDLFPCLTGFIPFWISLILESWPFIFLKSQTVSLSPLRLLLHITHNQCFGDFDSRFQKVFGVILTTHQSCGWPPLQVNPARSSHHSTASKNLRLPSISHCDAAFLFWDPSFSNEIEIILCYCTHVWHVSRSWKSTYADWLAIIMTTVKDP